jgi:epoxyqueuosine reductase QueG
MRSRASSLGNTDLTATNEILHETGHRICRVLQDRGVRALYPSYAFPMELQRFGTRMWSVSHKKVAIAAGLGHMGIHRNVIHPRFGSFIILGTILTQAELTSYGEPLEWNPCLGCNLCVASCPVGAIHVDGGFDFASCYAHNYHDFLSNFGDWVDELADSKDAADYRTRVSQHETLQLWQSIAFKPQYRSGYCVAVCPAGEDVVGPFLSDRKEHVRDVVRPLQQKPEPVYVTRGSSAERHVKKRFPNKTVRYVNATLEPPLEIDPTPRPQGPARRPPSNGGPPESDED